MIIPDKRTFIALPVSLSPGMVTLTDRLKTALREPGFKWVEHRQMHITLKFLGDTPVSLLGEISARVGTIVSECEELNGEINGLAYFSKNGDPSVLFAHLQNMPELERMARRVNESLESLGILPETKPFKSHLTLARIKFLRDKNRFREIIDAFGKNAVQPVNIREVVFYESILHSQGPVYRPLQIFALRSRT